MTQTIGGGVDALRSVLDGDALVAGDADYETARRVWNAGIDKHPGIVVRCRSTGDVVAAIGFAREHGLEIAVRGGGHGVNGMGVCDDGLLIDLGRMNEVTVDAAARKARVGGGALLRDLDAAALSEGLAVPAGMIGHTGVGGLTLGGGMGWLTRKFGLSIDNLVAVEIVTADGQVLRAAADEHSDLFWAVRGGGGNFGVVTAFEFQLHEVDPMVEFGLLFWPLEQGAAMLGMAREVISTLPPEINILIVAMNAPPEPFVPEQHHFVPGYAMMVAGFGAGQVHADLVARMRDQVPPLFEMVTPMPYVALQQITDEAVAWGSHAYEKSCYVDDLTDGVIEVIAEHVPRKNSPFSMVMMYRLDAAYSAVGEQDTAYSGGRSPRFCLFLVGFAPDADLLGLDRDWVRAFWDGLRPHSIGTGTYINGLYENGDEDRVLASYGREKYDRLAAIKAVYDPGNVFHLNANIKPL